MILRILVWYHSLCCDLHNNRNDGRNKKWRRKPYYKEYDVLNTSHSLVSDDTILFPLFGLFLHKLLQHIKYQT